MNRNDIFKIDLQGLEHLSSIAVSIYLWERADVKEKISYHNPHGISSLSYDPDDPDEKDDMIVTSGQKLVNYVFDQLDALNLPETLLPEVKILIVKIGQKIFYWRKYVTGALQLNSRYAEKIYWTSYGQIDELKILEEFWLKDVSFPGNQCSCFLNNPLYCFAAAYGQEEFVRSHLEDMKECILSYLPAWCRKKFSWTPKAVLATWMFFCKVQKKTPAIREFKNFTTFDSIPYRDLFLKGLTNNNEYGAKYFWYKLNVEEQINLVMEAAEHCVNVRNCLGYNCGTNCGNFTTLISYSKEKSIKMLLFFIDKMTEIQRMDFVSKNFILLFKLFFQVWPYQEFSDKFLYQMWDHVPGQDKDILTVILNILTFKRTDRPDYFTMKHFSLKILCNMLKKISKEIKISFLISHNYKIFRNLYRIFDNDTLNILVNDADLKDHRSEIIKIGNNYFKDFLRDGDHENINKFMKNMEFSAEEIKTFKENFNLFNGFLISGDLHLAKEHLNWLCDTDEERKKLKNNVNAEDIYFVLIQNYKFETADEFLLWRFDTEEEREKVKRPLKSEQFVINKIFEIWGRRNVSTNVDSYLEKCSELLRWYLKSEEEASEFKKLKIIQDEFFMEKYWNSQYGKKSLKNVDKFLKFCMMTPEEIQVMKINIAGNINCWIDNFALEKDQFPLVLSVLDWVFADDQNGKMTVIKNYMSSPRGTLLCFNVFKNISERSPSPVVKFFNEWIASPSFNFFEFNMQLENCDQSLFGRNVISCIKILLKEREQNRPVGTWNLSGFINSDSTG